MFRFKYSFSLALASLLTWTGPGLLQAEDEKESRTTYRVMYRMGANGEWREATAAGSPAKSKEGADQMAKQLKEKYRGGLAAVEVDVRAIAARPKIDLQALAGEWKWGFSIYRIHADGTVDQKFTLTPDRIAYQGTLTLDPNGQSIVMETYNPRNRPERRRLEGTIVSADEIKFIEGPYQVPGWTRSGHGMLERVKR